MNKERMEKLESIIKNLVSGFIFEEIMGEETDFGLITITGVKVSSDLSYADIYVSSLKNEEILPKKLAKHAYAIQKKMNKAISIRKLPKIRFRYDSTGENMAEMTSIIDGLDIKDID